MGLREEALQAEKEEGGEPSGSPSASSAQPVAMALETASIDTAIEVVMGGLLPQQPPDDASEAKPTPAPTIKTKGSVQLFKIS